MGEKSWKHYLLVTIQSIAAIYVATFCLGVFFIHRGDEWLKPAILLMILYAIVLFISIKRLVTQLPMAVLMIAAPTVPLIILLLVVAMVPILRLL